MKAYLLVGLLLAAPAFAQTGGQPGSAAKAPASGAMGGMDVGTELTTLTATLGLSDSQQSSARQILTERQTEVLAVRKEFPAPRPGASPPPGGPVKMRAVMKAAHARIDAILTPDQQAKYDRLDQTGSGPPAAAPGK